MNQITDAARAEARHSHTGQIIIGECEAQADMQIFIEMDGARPVSSYFHNIKGGGHLYVRVGRHTLCTARAFPV
jgi:uncharacterized protein GlcG (DUF336 family)